MTLIGKLFVFVNLVLSVLIAGAGCALYLNHINWTDKAGKDGGQEGRLLALRKKIDALIGSRAVIEQRWREARSPEVTSPEAKAASLLPLEKTRYDDRAWYQEQLEHIRKRAAADKPVLEVELDKDYQPVPDGTPLKRPKMRPATYNEKFPLDKSMLTYEGELQSKRQSNEKLLADLAKELEESTVETDKLGGKDVRAGLDELLRGCGRRSRD